MLRPRRSRGPPRRRRTSRGSSSRASAPTRSRSPSSCRSSTSALSSSASGSATKSCASIRRLAGELYLGVVPIGGSPDAPRVGATPAFEYAIEMRQFPDDARLDRQLERDRCRRRRCSSRGHARAIPRGAARDSAAGRCGGRDAPQRGDKSRRARALSRRRARKRAATNRGAARLDEVRRRSDPSGAREPRGAWRAPRVPR